VWIARQIWSGFLNYAEVLYKMKTYYAFALTILVGLTSCAGPQNSSATSLIPPQAQLEIKDGWYHFNGQKVFINALGYEIGARPGQHPKVQRPAEPERVRQDLKIIQSAGFNAVRTWAEFYESELQVVQESGMKVIMGIGYDPGADFGDPQVKAEFLELTSSVLEYSKNFDCIITYLIMNEPMPEHIRNVGAQATVDLWTAIRDLIYAEHPGVPVTITGNSAITEFVDMNIFDIYAYNSYVYDGFNYTHGYTNACRILPQMNGQGKPLMMTEFGFSVSPQGGEALYGGNTMQAQMEILPWYYRQLLDAGAAGACPFYYADGWWKGGAPDDHSVHPEEWFGFWGYASATDSIGYPRPVWHAVKTYNQALISSPKNQTFYQNEIPLEVFLQPEVAEMRVLHHDRLLLSMTNFSGSLLEEQLSFMNEPLTDRELIFEFYDQAGRLLKIESIMTLTGPDPIQWPRLTMKTPQTDLNQSQNLQVELILENDTLFILDREVRYQFSTHIGWSRGEKRSWRVDPVASTQSFQDSYVIPEQSPLLGLYAGTEIRYGKFVKTIHSEDLVYRGNWADPIRIK